jgi:hypothetical protein
MGKFRLDVGQRRNSMLNKFLGIIMEPFTGDKKEEEILKRKYLLLNEIINSIKIGNKDQKVDGLSKLSVLLEGIDNFDLSEFILKEIDSVAKDLNLEGVNWSNSRFVDMFLSDSNLKNAQLEKSFFMYTRMQWVDLENANLKNAKLAFASFTRCNLKNADLEGAYLFGVKFKNTNLLGANLRGANLQYADISDSLIMLSDLDLKNSLINRYTKEGEKLAPPNFRNATYDCDTKFPKELNPEKEGMIEVEKA